MCSWRKVQSICAEAAIHRHRNNSAKTLPKDRSDLADQESCRTFAKAQLHCRSLLHDEVQRQTKLIAMVIELRIIATSCFHFPRSAKALEIYGLASQLSDGCWNLVSNAPGMSKMGRS
jgi:hypothetical protein